MNEKYKRCNGYNKHVSMCYSAGDLGDLERRILDLSMKVLCPTGKYFTQVCGIMTRLKHTNYNTFYAVNITFPMHGKLIYHKSTDADLQEAIWTILNVTSVIVKSTQLTSSDLIT